MGPGPDSRDLRRICSSLGHPWGDRNREPSRSQLGKARFEHPPRTGSHTSGRWAASRDKSHLSENCQGGSGLSSRGALGLVVSRPFAVCQNPKEMNFGKRTRRQQAGGATPPRLAALVCPRLPYAKIILRNGNPTTTGVCDRFSVRLPKLPAILASGERALTSHADGTRTDARQPPQGKRAGMATGTEPPPGVSGGG